jgi:hypothetical protein
MLRRRINRTIRPDIVENDCVADAGRHPERIVHKIGGTAGKAIVEIDQYRPDALIACSRQCIDVRPKLLATFVPQNRQCLTLPPVGARRCGKTTVQSLDDERLASRSDDCAIRRPDRIGDVLACPWVGHGRGLQHIDRALRDVEAFLPREQLRDMPYVGMLADRLRTRQCRRSAVGGQRHFCEQEPLRGGGCIRFSNIIEQAAGTRPISIRAASVLPSDAAWRSSARAPGRSRGTGAPVSFHIASWNIALMLPDRPAWSISATASRMLPVWSRRSALATGSWFINHPKKGAGGNHRPPPYRTSASLVTRLEPGANTRVKVPTTNVVDGTPRPGS